MKKLHLSLSKKALLVILLATIIFSFASSLAVVYLAGDFYFDKTPESGFWVTVHGDIQPANEIKEFETINSKPQFLYVFYSYYNPYDLCRGGKVIEKTNISWVDDKYGKYSISFRAPVEMDVILTTDCTSGYYEILKLTEGIGNIKKDIEWGIKKERIRELGLAENPEDAIFQAEVWLAESEAKLSEKNDKPEKEDIKQDIVQGRKQIPEARRFKDSNESLLYAYYADWFAWRALYKIYLWELKESTAKINDLMIRYNDSCYIADYDSYEFFKSANKTYSDWADNYYLRKSPFNDREITIIKNDLHDMHSAVGKINYVNMESSDAFKRLNQTFEHQKRFCEKREKLFSSFNIALIVLAIEIGMLFGILFENPSDDS